VAKGCLITVFLNDESSRVYRFTDEPGGLTAGGNDYDEDSNFSFTSISEGSLTGRLVLSYSTFDPSVTFRKAAGDKYHELTIYDIDTGAGNAVTTDYTGWVDQVTQEGMSPTTVNIDTTDQGVQLIRSISAQVSDAILILTGGTVTTCSRCRRRIKALNDMGETVVNYLKGL
jgi:hypothetical protein